MSGAVSPPDDPDFLSGRIPDTERSRRNFSSFLEENPAYRERALAEKERICLLFSYCQFLANHCTRYPDSLFAGLESIGQAPDFDRLRSELFNRLSGCSSFGEGMREIRLFRKNIFIPITLRELLGTLDFSGTMVELSSLADIILDESLTFVENLIRKRYGAPVDNSFCILALGKLGAQELNYSSDIDIVFLYFHDGETTGVSAIRGTVMNRVTAAEYYTKLAEELTRFISGVTEDGIAYRVDLRLRPQGQRGNLALSLRSYEEYYESWGQLWERAALLRARPAAGDLDLGEAFLTTVRPFIYRKYLDFDAVNEIRRLKSQVEHIRTGTFSSDIKRGYGGIREVEFFIQVFQLMHGGKEPLIREKSTLRALHRLAQKGLIGHEDMRILSENYLFLRILEHRLQQLNDLQVHTLPSSEDDQEILARKMAFHDRESFLMNLNARRVRIREIYDVLLGTSEYVPEAPSSVPVCRILDDYFWEMDSPIEPLIEQEISRFPVRNIPKAIYFLSKIRNTMHSFQTLRGRMLLNTLLPSFIGESLQSANPDLALLHLVDFANILAVKESYLEILSRRPELIYSLAFVFSTGEYLSRIIMSDPAYTDMLVEDRFGIKTRSTLELELSRFAAVRGLPSALRLLKKSNELRFGMLFLTGATPVTRLVKSLTAVAEIVLSVSLRSVAGDVPHPAAIAFGKLGGREIAFNSDLDIVFVTDGEPSDRDIRTAESLLRSLMSYTREGTAYSVDTRLRPEGTKGPLVNSIEGLDRYYRTSAHPWELQALLKARPIGAKKETAFRFLDMKRRILAGRSGEVPFAEIRKMRDRILREKARESRENHARTPADQSFQHRTFDIKLGAGGIEELEFAVQYLQMKHCRNKPEILVQGTLDAVRRLRSTGILGDRKADFLTGTYLFFRTLECFLRLRNETTLRSNGDTLTGVARFMNREAETFIAELEEKRKAVCAFTEELV